ncbi:MAG TPA: Scr1 family TA system antitoxin-like transcriptional regulator, partial [Streptomyces sp.]
SHLPHVTVQVLPFEAGAHPGLSGQFAVLEFTDATDATVVYLEGVNSDLYLEKDTDVQAYSVMYEHLRAQALSAEQTRQFITEAAERYAG